MPASGTAVVGNMDPEKNDDNLNPKVKANPFSLLVFWWLKDLFWKGTRKELDYSDLYDTLPVHKSMVLGQKLERNWLEELENSRTKQRRPNLLIALWKTFRIRFIVYGCGLLIHSCIFLVMTPVFLKLVIQHFSPDVTSTWGEACRYVLGLVLCGMTSAVVLHHSNCGNLALGMMARVACSSLVYRKTLHLSKAALDTAATKQLVDLLSTDLKRFDQSTFFLHYIWILPLQTAVVTAICWHSLGPSVLVGVGSIFLQTVPTQAIMNKCTAWLRTKITTKTAERVSLISEVVNNMQFIKMFVWEKPIEKLINISRRKEMDVIFRAGCLRGLGISFAVFPERVGLFLTLGSYVLFGNHDITADKVFTIAAYYSILCRTMGIRFPNAIQIASETTTSIRRLEKYLLEKEIDTKRMTIHNRSKVAENEKLDVKLVKATARWASTAMCETIFKISLNLKHGKLCAVIGPPDSGKSSLIHAILGELPLSSGTLAVGGHVSYASQEPWLFVGTVRQNILFGEPYEPKRYKEVVRACALQDDFERFPYGDKTIISDRGTSLSSDQRAKINIARAVYRRSDLYLLDDPLSSIDAHIGQHILEDCICTFISKKTRIIVTSQLQWVKKADHIIVMNNAVPLWPAQTTITPTRVTHLLPPRLGDSVIAIGLPRSGRGMPDSNRRPECHETTPLGQIEIQGTFEELQANMINFDSFLNNSEIGMEEPGHHSFVREESNMSTRSSLAENDEEAGGDEATERTGMLHRKYSNLTAAVEYMRSGGSAVYLGFLLFLLVLCQLATSGTDYWVSLWTTAEETRGLFVEFQAEQVNSSLVDHLARNASSRALDAEELDYRQELAEDESQDSPGNTTGWEEWPPPDLSHDVVNGTRPHPWLAREASLGVYAALVSATVLLTVAKSLAFFKACVAAAGKLHAALCRGILAAPITFFRSLPSERILARFSADFAVIDETLPRTLSETFQICLNVSGALILIIITNYLLVVPMLFVAAAIYKMSNIFSKTIQDMRRLEGTTRSPVLTHLTTTLAGLATIRACDSQDVMSVDFYTYQDIHTSAYYLLFATVAASAFWFDFVINIFVGCVSFSFLLLEKGAGTPASDVGLAISQSMILIGMLHYGIRCAAETVSHMGAVQRVLEHAKTPEEEGIEFQPGTKPLPTWPSGGSIQFDHLSLRCFNDDSLALKNITVTIDPGQKVGVIGCSEAGKEALVSSLLRLAPYEGTVRIDKVDIRNVGLRDLRRSISVMSGEPVTFTTSLRNNLDPHHVHSNEALWTALQEVELNDSERSLLIPIGAGGSNYPRDQKQLICLARAILRNNKILILDEALNRMDPQTDTLIQAILKRKFKDCTVLTIAHSLKNIIDSDRIMVIDAGNMVEYGHPHILLQKPGGYFYRMVQECGTSQAEHLCRIAQEAYRQNEPEAETPEVEEE